MFFDRRINKPGTGRFLRGAREKTRLNAALRLETRRRWVLSVLRVVKRELYLNWARHPADVESLPSDGRGSRAEWKSDVLLPDNVLGFNGGRPASGKLTA